MILTLESSEIIFHHIVNWFENEKKDFPLLE